MAPFRRDKPAGPSGKGGPKKPFAGPKKFGAKKGPAGSGDDARPASGAKKPFGKKPFGAAGGAAKPAFGKKPFGKPAFGAKPWKKREEDEGASGDDRDERRAKPAFGGPKKSFGKSFGEKKSFGDKKPFGAKKPFEKKPWAKRDDAGAGDDAKPSYAKKTFGDKKPFGAKKAYGDKPAFGAKKPFEKKPFEKKPWAKREDAGSDDAKPSYAKKSFGDKKPFGAKKAYGDKPAFGAKKPFEKKPWAKRDDAGAGDGAKPSYAKKSFGDKKPFGAKKPFEKKPFEKKPWAKRDDAGAGDDAKPSYAKKSFGAKKAYGDKPAFGAKKPFEKKPYDKKPFERRERDADERPRTRPSAPRAFVPRSVAPPVSPEKLASPARRMALEALTEVRAGRPLPVEVAAQRDADGRDIALAREIAAGVVRRRRWLEQVLALRLERPIESTAPAVHDALLMGVYQLAFLDRVPAHAIVDETVKLVAADPKGEALVGLANAVMRRLSEQDRESLRPTDDTPWPVATSMPDAVAEQLRAVLPEDEAAAFAAACSQTAPLCLRAVGSARATLDATDTEVGEQASDVVERVIEVKRGALVPECLLIDAADLAPTRLEAFRVGHVTVEDEGAQAAAWLAGAGVRGAVLDLCASPGGKTAHLADIAAPGTEITACDVGATKLERLRETLMRVGLIRQVDVREAEDVLAAPPRGGFDLAVVDAPCSALGTLRRHPEARERWNHATSAELVRLQASLLDQAAAMVKAGGLLVYIVCTWTRAECEEQVAEFLNTHPRFEPAPAPEGLPFDAAAIRSAPGQWRTWTHRHGCDAFFVARFRKKA